MALPLVLLLLVALTALTHGALLLSLEQAAASRATVAFLQARLAAEGGLRRALRSLELDTLPAGAAAVLLVGDAGPARYRVAFRRLDGEIVLLEGWARAALGPGGPERVELGLARVLWALSPEERVGDFEAVVEHRGGVFASDPDAVDGSDAADPGTLEAPRGCLDRAALLDSLLPTRWLPEQRRVTWDSAHAVPPLGLLPGDSVVARITRAPGVRVTPAPRSTGDVCHTADTLNWGSPLDPAAPCGGYRPARAFAGDVSIEGGEGQGVLAVEGDLTVSGGARYEGVVLVGGDLHVEDGASVAGLVRAGGVVVVRGGGRIEGRLCPALLALEAAHGLARPLVVPGGGWIRLPPGGSGDLDR